MKNKADRVGEAVNTAIRAQEKLGEIGTSRKLSKRRADIKRKQKQAEKVVAKTMGEEGKKRLFDHVNAIGANAATAETAARDIYRGIKPLQLPVSLDP